MRLANPFKKIEEQNNKEQETEEQVRIIEKAITLEYLNEKINMIIGLLQEIHQAANIQNERTTNGTTDPKKE